MTLSPATSTHHRLPIRQYDLECTLDSGQTFAWRRIAEPPPSRASPAVGTPLPPDSQVPALVSFQAVIAGRWVQLRQRPGFLEATTAKPQTDWTWLSDYLQTELDLTALTDTLPPDPPLLLARQAFPGLRLLRQDPWECLASFLLSATKQIVQIQLITRELCRRFGTPVTVPPDHPVAHAFPSPRQIAAAGEPALRECRMGFRARYLLEVARQTVDGRFRPYELRNLPLELARTRLLALPGVGPKIADCVLLFSGDQPRAFPIDVWVSRTLRHHYFAGQSVPLPALQAFVARRFGPSAGYAQQLLFHYARRHPQLVASQPAAAPS